MRIKKCPLDGILLIEPVLYQDKRGFFQESYQEDRYAKIGITEKFVQNSHSRSVKNVLRGLHFTLKKPQSQIVTVIRGKIFDVVVDIRENSPTFGRWFGTELSEDGLRQIYMPHGFAHGFYVLSNRADLHYQVSQVYDQADEGGVLWKCKTLKIKWPCRTPSLSIRDKTHKTFDEIIRHKI
jgi:dTDP-4-dehydrorhamnose 3,5-epimerase